VDAVVRPHLRRDHDGSGHGADRVLGGLAGAPRRAPSGQDPLRAYGTIELAVGATALLSLPLLRALPWAYGTLVAGSGLSGPAESIGIAFLAALVLLPPTVLLGATVPLATEFLARAGTDVPAGFGRLYLLNTLGGALGVALAPFVLVPALGVRATLVVAAGASSSWAGSRGAGRARSARRGRAARSPLPSPAQP
jgi:spermidine synthase